MSRKILLASIMGFGISFQAVPTVAQVKTWQYTETVKDSTANTSRFVLQQGLSANTDADYNVVHNDTTGILIVAVNDSAHTFDLYPYQTAKIAHNTFKQIWIKGNSPVHYQIVKGGVDIVRQSDSGNGNRGEGIVSGITQIVSDDGSIIITDAGGPTAHEQVNKVAYRKVTGLSPMCIPFGGSNGAMTQWGKLMFDTSARKMTIHGSIVMDGDLPSRYPTIQFCATNDSTHGGNNPGLYWYTEDTSVTHTPYQQQQISVLVHKNANNGDLHRHLKIYTTGRDFITGMSRFALQYGKDYVTPYFENLDYMSFDRDARSYYDKIFLDLNPESDTTNLYPSFHLLDVWNEGSYSPWSSGYIEEKKDSMKFSLEDSYTKRKVLGMMLTPKGLSVGTTAHDSSLEANGIKAHDAIFKPYNNGQSFSNGVAVRESDDGNDAVRIQSNTTRGHFEILSSGTTSLSLDGYADCYINGNSSNQKLGIGTLSPSKLLDVNGTSRLRSAVTLDSNTANPSTPSAGQMVFESRGIDGMYTTDCRGFRSRLQSGFGQADSLSGSQLTVDWSRPNTVFYASLTSNTTLTFINVREKAIRVALTNSPPGYTVTFPGGIRWPAGTVPAVSTSNATDIFEFEQIGSYTYGYLVGSMMEAANRTPTK